MSFGGMLNQTLTVKNPGTGRDKDGNETLGSSFTVRGRLERTAGTVVTPERERDPVHALVAVNSDANIEHGAQITYQGTKYRVLTIADAIGMDGSIHHSELKCQLWNFA